MVDAGCASAAAAAGEPAAQGIGPGRRGQRRAHTDAIAISQTHHNRMGALWLRAREPVGEHPLRAPRPRRIG